MKYKSILLIFAALLAVSLYLFGYHVGARAAVQREWQAKLVGAMFYYQMAGTTNIAYIGRLKGNLGMEVFALTREYERRYGCPTGTNSFAKHFADAKIMADQIQGTLVPLSSLTNVFTNVAIHIKTAE